MPQPRKPVTHQCQVCGQPAHYGVGVFLRHGQMGRWYCHAHWLLTPEGQARVADLMREVTGMIE